MTTGLSIAVIILAILAFWQMLLLREWRARARRWSAPPLPAPAPSASATEPPRWFRSVIRRERGLEARLAKIEAFVSYRSNAFRAVHPGEEVPNLEQFINMLLTGRIETFRLGIEQQLPMLAALRYATDEKLADVVTGLRKAFTDQAATRSQLAGHEEPIAMPSAPADESR